MNVNWKDVGTRALKTFVQTFVSCVVAGLSGVNFMVLDQSANWMLSLALSAGAAGFSAVWNGILNPIFNPPTE